MPSGSYGWITFLQAKQQLAARLDDPNNVHWADVELGLYLNEALTVWQALTGYWRERGTFVMVPSQIFYDLPTLLTDSGGNRMLQMSAIDVDVVTLMQYHLLEPPVIPWAGSTQFTLAELTNSLEATRDNFLAETGSVITHSVINVLPSPIGRVPLDDHIIDVRRVAWLPVPPGSGLNHIPLWMSDEFSSGAILPGWNLSPDQPEAYSILAPLPLQLQLIPPPIDKGQCDLLTVNAGAALDPTIGVPIGLPTNFVWAAKWGALADLLSQDGEPRDDFRAGYCRQRYDEACEIARAMPVVITAAIDEVDVFPQSVAELDAFRPGWAGVDGSPDAIACAGQNMVAIAPPPDASGPYSFRADVVRNAVVPVNNGDFIQLGREYLDAVIDEAFHLALFKSGGSEFADTIPLHQAFIKDAASHNDKLRAMSIYLNACQSQSTEETKVRPRKETDAEVTA